ncbi:hypothetical protein DPMN_087556 [Dreissena polymorpha]|uniref:B box-type domain-containing protein n=1 Tax=Dreissena polymorpha TaxID=45954 RepID=A0A9D4QX06_DREPO|nr:hypothetical protein DPMN_087556 [Dreissena polymorpha]
MATGSFSSLPKRLRMVENFCCTSCLEQNLEESADIYCETCLRFYCKKCVIHHGQLFTKHKTCGRGDIQKWPVLKAEEDFLRMCEFHEDKTLAQFCHDHSQLCCSDCVLTIHSQCSKVTPILELTNTQHTDLQGLSVELETVLGEVKSLHISQELSVQSLQGTYKEHKAYIKKQMLVHINTTIDECVNSSVSTSDKNEQYIKEEMCRTVLSILNEFDNITVKELNEMKDEVISIKGSVTSLIHKCAGLHNDLSQFHELVQKIGDNKELCLITSIKCKPIIQQAWTLLGKSAKVFNVEGNSEHNVRIPSDLCYMTGICVLPDGQILIADYNKKKITLLDQLFKVVSHCGMTARPQDICLITPSKVAMAVNDLKTHEVQFITVTKSQLIPGRKFQLQHRCYGFAHHQGDLFICSGTVLFKYSLSGKQVCRLYVDKSDDCTVYRCAVSPTGDKLYITNYSQDKLLTLARDGTLLATFTDPALDSPEGVHVTPAGQVLVCGHWSHTLLQVDTEGRMTLATLATQEWDGVLRPVSVCYSIPC